MTEYNLIEDVEPKRIFSAHVVAPFDKGKILLESRNYRISSLEENVELRMQEGSKSDISRNGNWVLEDTIYVSGRGVFLTKKSPIMDNAKKAVEEQRNGREFYLEEVEKYLEGALRLDDKSFSINRSGERFIPTNRFNDFEITRYAFGKYADNYGKFLKENGINEMLIWLSYIQDKPFARKLWFGGLDIGSGLLCNCGNLFGDYRVRGVKMSAEGTQKI